MEDYKGLGLPFLMDRQEPTKCRVVSYMLLSACFVYLFVQGNDASFLVSFHILAYYMFC